jgi:hypothetical protein
MSNFFTVEGAGYFRTWLLAFIFIPGWGGAGISHSIGLISLAMLRLFGNTQAKVVRTVAFKLRISFHFIFSYVLL